MSTPTSDDGCYEIRFQGHLHARWHDFFDGLTSTPEPGGATLLRGEAVDQAALHGLLQTLADLGLPLLSVTRIEPGLPRAASAIEPINQGDIT